MNMVRGMRPALPFCHQFSEGMSWLRAGKSPPQEGSGTLLICNFSLMKTSGEGKVIPGLLDSQRGH